MRRKVRCKTISASELQDNFSVLSSKTGQGLSQRSGDRCANIVILQSRPSTSHLRGLLQIPRHHLHISSKHNRLLVGGGLG